MGVDEHLHSLGKNSVGAQRSGESEQSQMWGMSWWQGKTSQGVF